MSNIGAYTPFSRALQLHITLNRNNDHIHNLKQQASEYGFQVNIDDSHSKSRYSSNFLVEEKEPSNDANHPNDQGHSDNLQIDIKIDRRQLTFKNTIVTDLSIFSYILGYLSLYDVLKGVALVSTMTNNNMHNCQLQTYLLNNSLNEGYTNAVRVTENNIDHIINYMKNPNVLISTIDISELMKYEDIIVICKLLTKQPKITTLCFGDFFITYTQRKTIFNNIPHITHLAFKQLHYKPNDLILQLCDCEYIKLKTLDLSYTTLKITTVVNLLNSTLTENLISINLTNTGISFTSKAAIIFFASKNVCQLENLNLTGNNVEEEFIQYMLNYKAIFKLQSIHLSGNSITVKTLKNLLTSKALPKLGNIIINNGSLTEETLRQGMGSLYIEHKHKLQFI